jgi:NTE family protein
METRAPVRVEDLGDRPWLVLGGGGLKGLAHIGVWRALSERGLELAGVVGTSIGGLLAIRFATGASWQELRSEALALRRSDIVRVNRRIVWVNGIQQSSVFRGEVLRRFLEARVPAGDWGQLQMPCQVNAVSLRSGESVWFGAGGRDDVTILDAVHASSSLPVLYPPVPIDGDFFVDGGVVDMLGLDRAAEMGATGILAVDAGSSGEEDPSVVVEQGVVGIHQRVFGIMSSRRRSRKLAAWTEPPLLLVRPNLEGYGVFDFEHVEYFIEEGYRAAAQALTRPRG